MRNRVITGNGKSNNLKMDMSNIDNFSQFKAAAAQGMLTADIVATTDGTGTEVVGTPLTAENILTDETAEALGVASSDPTPEEAFESLKITQSVIDAFSAIGIDLTNVGG